MLGVLGALAGSSCATADAGGGIAVAGTTNVVRYPIGERRLAPALRGTGLRTEAPVPEDLLSGKVGVVNFWGSWCGPCRAEQPLLESLWKEYRAGGVQFVGVNTRDQRAAALAFLDEFNVTYPSLYNPDALIAHDYRVRYMPDTYVIDAHGRIAAVVVGALRSEDVLRKILDEEIR